jgi:sugar O-acyltransferase (sialic acid O-acetyltransferase NeuD family)
MTERPIIVLGAGGHARVVIDALRAVGATILGVVAPPTATRIQGVDLLGDDDVIDRFATDRVSLANGLGSVERPVQRRAIYERFKARGYQFATIRHPFSSVAADASLGEGAQIMAGAVVQSGAAIGANVIVNTRASIDHDCKIGDHCHIAPGVTVSGSVLVGTGVHVGTGATIIQGIQIGDGATVGAGAVVVRDVRTNAHVLGVPAREVRT